MRLPHFPLHTVLFPHLPLPLHLFEERYRAMASDLMAPDSPWGGRLVVSMITSGPEVGGDAMTQGVGTICEVHMEDAKGKNYEAHVDVAANKLLRVKD